MEILLEGVRKEFREQVKDFIGQMLKIAFKDEDISFIKKISIPSDIIEEIDEFYNENSYNPPMYGDLGGKNINMQGVSKIFLNKLPYENGISSKEINEDLLLFQCNTLYHELMHAKVYSENYKRYNDFVNYVYPIDRILFDQAYNMWDEYNAVKQSTICFYSEFQNSWFNELSKVLFEKYNEEINRITDYYHEGDWNKIFSTTLTYIGEVIRYLSMVLGIMDGLSELIGEEATSFKECQEIYTESFIGQSYFDIWKELKNVNELPTEIDLINIGDCLRNIYYDFGVLWDVTEEGKYDVYLTKDLENNED